MLSDPAARRRMAIDFLRFGTVGAAGFVVDTAVVYATRAWLGLYLAGVLSFLVAASFTWLGNRLWTFRGRGAGRMHAQWARFVAANTLGFLLNRGTYAILVTVSALCAEQPVLAIFAGMLAGMLANFHFSRTMVFR